jgi:hypothetical protein
VRQPAIDGGEGLVYLAGDGIAAVDKGAVVWSTRSSAAWSATAFGDGTLAVSAGDRLRIVGRDGAVKRELAAPDGAVFVTPPAVGADGAVWIASAAALYVAR